MEIQNTQGVDKTKPNGSVKKKFFLILIVILLALAAYGFFWVQRSLKTIKTAEGAIAELQDLRKQNDAMKKEVLRCQEFISQKEGEFGSFEYCKKFIEWAQVNLYE
ncbi:MAG: hypothetical protein COU27_01195 [Candidatus Levybacteria bacterium CG10_big_fil_rev_8_21_14_0_10_36_7]|nr:MAG: hypothetical protein COU27_01195 [Candidatus Levybacteria bacterium CG10_big_fil_rev_8_21_14_0_10_36_7]